MTTHRWAVASLLATAANAQEQLPITSYLPNWQAPVAQSAGSFDIADVDGDSRFDIVAAVRVGILNDPDVFHILLGRGDATFEEPLVVETTNQSNTVLLVDDLDGDGHPDLVSRPFPNDGDVELRWHQGGEPASAYGAALPLPVGANHFAREVLAEDLNGDGLCELVVWLLGDHERLEIFAQSAPREFELAQTFPLLAEPEQIFLRDWDGDGVLDLVEIGKDDEEADDSIVLVRASAGDATFATDPDLLRWEWDELAFGEVTGDDLVDVFAKDVRNGDGDRFATLPGLGSGSFGDPLIHGIVIKLTEMQLVDVTGDGALDVLGKRLGGLLTFLPGTGAGSFGEPVDFDSGSFADLHPVDLDHDGLTDIVHGGGRLRVLLGAGGRRGFVAPPELAPQGTAWAVDDLIGDERDEIVVERLDLIEIVGIDEQGALVTLASVPFDDVDSAATGDFDGDGDRDVALVDTEELRVLFNLGEGGFELGDPQSVPPGFSRLQSARLDEGELDDLVYFADHFDETVHTLLSAGDGSFVLADAPMSWSRVSLTGDFNGDGFSDLATAQTHLTEVEVWFGDGEGSFVPSQTIDTGRTGWGLLWTNFDGVGADDLLVLHRDDSELSSLAGNADGTFANPELHSDTLAELTEAGTGDVPGFAAGDWNADGVSDVVFSSSGALSLYLNDGTGELARMTFHSAQSTFTDTLLAGHLGGGPGPDLVIDGAVDEVLLDLRHPPSSLVGVPFQAMAGSPIAQTLQLDAGPAFAAATFVVLGSADGTWPPTALGSVLVPLASDSYFEATQTLGWTGILDERGTATFELTLPGHHPTSSGTLLQHAFVALNAAERSVFVSNAAPLLLR